MTNLALAAASATCDGEARDLRWYVARTNRKEERLARHSLKAEGIGAYLPMMPKKNKAGELYAAPLFPGFVFVAFMLTGGGWTTVFSARGVSSVLGTGGRPQPISTFGLEQIRRRELEAFEKAQLVAEPCRLLRPGDRVTFKKGPWTALDGEFQRYTDRHRCAVLISFLGADREAEAELAHIEDRAAGE